MTWKNDRFRETVIFSAMYIEIITLLQQLLLWFNTYEIHKHKFVAFMFMPNKSIIILLQLLHYLVVQHVKNITVWCTWKILHRTDCYKSDFIRKICLCWGKKKRTKFKIRRSLILRVSPELPWRVAGHYWTPIKLCVQRNAECWNSSLWTIRCFHSSSETLVNLTDTHFSSSWEQ